MRVLDAGAYGVVCPMVNNAEEAQAFVGACRYAPQGYRSYGPIRAAVYGGADYFTHANHHILTFAMVETAEALANVEAIAATDGLDGIYIGAMDLSVSLGIPLSDPANPRLLEAIQTIIQTAHQYGKVIGMHARSVEHGHAIAQQGCQLVTLMNDSTALNLAFKSTVEHARKLF
jgi:4-hydroxy-2-oxoheptanedioate aldolase